MSARRARRPGLAADARGATAAEFALTLPVLVALIVGGLQFGWAQHCASSLHAALEQAGRALLIDPSMDQASLQALVRDKLASNADPDVTVTLSIQTASDGSRIARLTGEYMHQIGVPTLASYPIDYQTTVTTALPPS